MIEKLDLSKPLFTKRGGVVTEFRERNSGDGDSSFHGQKDSWIGIETYRGKTATVGWRNDFTYWGEGESSPHDLTNTPPTSNTPPADYTPPASPPDELTALRERIAELEHQLRQANKANAEAWRVAVNYQRAAAKGAVR